MQTTRHAFCKIFRCRACTKHLENFAEYVTTVTTMSSEGAKSAWLVVWLEGHKATKRQRKRRKSKKKLPLTGARRLKGSEKEGKATIQAPLPHIRISNTSCSFLAFSKAKNAHMGRGSPIRINVWESKFLTCKHDDSLISYIDPE